MQRQVTSIRLSEEEKTRLSKHANDMKVSRAELVRAILTVYFENHARGGHLAREVADIIRGIK